MPTGFGDTHSKLDPSEVHIGLLQPVIEVLRVVGGVALSVCGHAEDYQGLVDLGQAAQVGLERRGCHHHGLSPQLRNRVAGGKACQEAPHASPINLKPSLEMGEDPRGRSVEGTKCALERCLFSWAVGVCVLPKTLYGSQRGNS